MSILHSCVIKAGLCHLLPYHPVPTTDEIIILFCKCLFICLFFTLGNQEFLFLLFFFSFFFFEELEEESVLYLIDDSISLCITAVSQGRSSHRTGAWRQELEQRPQKSIAYRLLPMSSSACFLIEPAQGWPHPQKPDPFFNNH